MSQRAAALQRTLLAEDGQANSGGGEGGGKGGEPPPSAYNVYKDTTMATPISSLVTERRVMLVTIGLLLVGMVLMIVASCTDHWAELTCLPYYHRRHQAYVFGYHTGIWRTCYYVASHLPEPPISPGDHPANDTSVTSLMVTAELVTALARAAAGPSQTGQKVTKRCEMVDFYPTHEEVENYAFDIDYEILNYSRSETAFAIISLLLMLIGLFFSAYCLKEPRYMFKRLAAVLHLISAICKLVCAEVFINSINYEQRHLPKRYPPSTLRVSFGYSFAFVWVAFAFDLIACIVYFVLGRKRKRERARNDREAFENEPVVLGRI